MQQEPISVSVEKKRQETKTESSHAYLTLQDKVKICRIDCNRYSKA